MTGTHRATPAWTAPRPVTFVDQAGGVRMAIWPTGQCLVVHVPQAATRWLRLADVVIHTTDRDDSSILAVLPGCLLVVTHGICREGGLARDRSGQCRALTASCADLERWAVVAYSWITAGRCLTTMP